MADWTRRDVAHACGWRDVNTVSRMATITRRKVRASEPLSADDFPLPHKHVERTPLWDSDAVVTWLENRPGVGSGRWSQRASFPCDATDVRVDDVLFVDAMRLLVRERTVTDDAVNLRVATDRRGNTRWIPLRRNESVRVWRPVP